MPVSKISLPLKMRTLLMFVVFKIELITFCIKQDGRDDKLLVKIATFCPPKKLFWTCFTRSWFQVRTFIMKLALENLDVFCKKVGRHILFGGCPEMLSIICLHYWIESHILKRDMLILSMFKVNY